MDPAHTAPIPYPLPLFVHVCDHGIRAIEFGFKIFVKILAKNLNKVIQENAKK
jgi:hypothetical protein